MALPDKPGDRAEAKEELLCRLVALNAARAAEEAKGQVRWLRPDYQNPGAASPTQEGLGMVQRGEGRYRRVA